MKHHDINFSFDSYYSLFITYGFSTACNVTDVFLSPLEQSVLLHARTIRARVVTRVHLSVNSKTQSFCCMSRGQCSCLSNWNCIYHLYLCKQSADFFLWRTQMFACLVDFLSLSLSDMDFSFKLT